MHKNVKLLWFLSFGIEIYIYCKCITLESSFTATCMVNFNKWPFSRCQAFSDVIEMNVVYGIQGLESMGWKGCAVL